VDGLSRKLSSHHPLRIGSKCRDLLSRYYLDGEARPHRHRARDDDGLHPLLLHQCRSGEEIVRSLMVS